ncbi:MAG: YfhO family protein [Lachnospiraceae bacterium]|nr:YfhO family protein [Lachnospiraceae bacterium]
MTAKLNNEKLKYIIPILITMLLYCVILCVKHIFPFGSRTIDYYDMAQQIAPFYYHVYDMLHGSTSFFFNFYSALGTNMAMSTSGCSNLSLFNLFFLLIPRSGLLQSLSVFHLIKLCAMTFTMYFYLHKTYRAPFFVETVLSVDYAFCGFVLMLYITNQWMDIAVLLPVIMYYYDRMMKGGRITGYVVTLTAAVVNSYYLSLMILLFLFLYTGLRILSERLYIPVQNRKRTYLLELGFASFLAVLLSSFILVPQLLQTLSSARFLNASPAESAGMPSLLSRYTEMLRQLTPAYTTRWWALLNLTFAAAVILTGLIRYRKKRRERFMTIGLILMMILELFLESINLIWHFGSYVQYPIRNGFIIAFVFLTLACHYAEKLFENKTVEKASFLGLSVTVLVFAAFAVLYGRHPGMQIRTVLHITAALMLTAFIGYLLLFFWKGGAHYSLSLMIVCTEILCTGLLLYGKPSFITGYSEEPEQDGEYIRICEQLKENFDLSENYLYRIKNPDESLNANYGFVLERPALSNWTHMISPGLQKGAAEWGYSMQFTRILDAGGTVFTDALLGIRNVISCLPQDEALYELTDSAEIVINSETGETMPYYYYKCRYTLPFGVPVYSSAMFDSELENRNIVSLQNQMYRSLTGAETGDEQEISRFIVRNGQLTDDTDTSELLVSALSPSVKRYFLNADVKGKKALYFSSSAADSEDDNMTISIADRDGQRPVYVPTIKEPFHVSYPAHFNNNVIYLGTFENEVVSVIVDVDIEKGRDLPVHVSELDLEKLTLLCDSYRDFPDDYITAGKKSISFSVDVEESAGSTVMLLPLAYDDGWQLRINGNKTDILYAYSGLFTAIPLYTDVNRYDLSYTPPGMGPGTALSLVGILVFAAIIIIRWQNIRMIEDELVILSRDSQSILVPAYMVLWSCALFMIYIIPLAAGVYYAIRGTGL